MKRHTAYLDISPEIIVEILKGLSSPNRSRRFEVIKNALPKDVRLERIEYDFERNVLRAHLNSEHFEKDDLQLIPPMLKIVFDT